MVLELNQPLTATALDIFTEERVIMRLFTPMAETAVIQISQLPIPDAKKRLHLFLLPYCSHKDRLDGTVIINHHSHKEKVDSIKMSRITGVESLLANSSESVKHLKFQNIIHVLED